MRKYNNKMKKTLIIIVVVFVVFVVIFSLFLKKSMAIAKSVYTVDVGSILFDSDRNMITTKTAATIRLKWGGEYYLKYEDNSYNLTDHVVVYNSNTGDIKLYGKFYEVKKNGDVVVRKDESEVKSSVNSEFYKLADRKYLIIDRTIESTTTSFVTSNYLIVDLDKTGNATLLNDKVSLKTLKATKLKTSAYVFDINNEIINFGKEDVDLKKIIGSSNVYDEDTYDLNKEKSDAKDDTMTNNNADGTGSGNGNGSGSGTNSDSNLGNDTNGNSGANNSNNGQNVNANGTTSSNSSSYNNNYDSGISDSAVADIIKATKNTSVIRVSSNINSISVDYVVYDPDNEYKTVYIEVENTVTGKNSIVYLPRNDTNIVIDNLEPNVYYNLNFKYTYSEGGSDKEYTFDKFGLYTEIPTMNLVVSKIVNDKLYYKINLGGNYTIVGGVLNLMVNGQAALNSSFSAKGNTNQISGDDCYFDLSSLNLNRNDDYVITVRLTSLSFDTYTISPNLSYKFKY